MKKELARLLEDAGGSTLVFDIDDTLLSTAHRQVRILREYARLRPQARALAEVAPERTRYQVADTARESGVQDPALLEELRDFWFRRFFTNEYLREDRPVPGAPEFCRLALAAGARVVYLTGRDETMREGTLASLEAHGFPLPGDGARLILKPRFDMADDEFKSGAVAEVRALGPVAGGFDNEPSYANLYARSFPGARVFLLDTKHSGRPVEPDPAVSRIPDFVL